MQRIAVFFVSKHQSIMSFSEQACYPYFYFIRWSGLHVKPLLNISHGCFINFPYIGKSHQNKVFINAKGRLEHQFGYDKEVIP